MSALRPVPGTLRTLSRLQNKEETDNDMISIWNSIEEHLKSPAGTLANYNGKYGPTLISLLVERGYLTKETVEAHTTEKLKQVSDKILYDFYHNKKCKYNPAMLKIAVDFLQGRDSETEMSNNNVVVVGYPLEQSGIETQPEKRLTHL